MIDKRPKIGYNESATLFDNKFGKEPGTGALSHTSVNLTKYFGYKATRLIASLLFNGVAPTNSNRCSNWAGSFLSKYKPKPANARNADRLLTSNERGTFAVADQILTLPPEDGNLDHLSDSELSGLLDLIQSQIEYHRDELARLKPILHRLQRQIPNSPIFEFINQLELSEEA